MKTVSYEEFLDFKPCWVSDKALAARLAEYGKRRERWTALDVLALEEVSVEDRLRAVLREEFIDAPILHEFACRCAERAVSRIENPDPRSIAAIDAKRKWLRSEIDDAALHKARNAACEAVAAAWAASVSARAAARDAAAAAWAASVSARAAARDAAAAAWAASVSACAAAWDAAGDAAKDAERNAQLECLRELMLNAA